MFNILVVIILACNVGYSTAGLPQKLVFPADISLENYVLLRPDLAKAKDSITICSWVKTFKQDSENRFWLSYCAAASCNEIILDAHTKHFVFFDDAMERTEIIQLNVWSHMCLTWSKASRIKQFYLNGAMVMSETTPEGRSLSLDGIIALGQEQDSPGGGFDINQTFGGEIYETNIFGRDLSGEEIWRIHQAGLCFPLSGFTRDLVVGWTEILQAQRSGAVTATALGCDRWDLLKSFIGQEVTEQLIAHLKNYHMD